MESLKAFPDKGEIELSNKNLKDRSDKYPTPVLEEGNYNNTYLKSNGKSHLKLMITGKPHATLVIHYHQEVDRNVALHSASVQINSEGKYSSYYQLPSNNCEVMFEMSSKINDIYENIKSEDEESMIVNYEFCNKPK